jgi:hypothetical protein
MSSPGCCWAPLAHNGFEPLPVPIEVPVPTAAPRFLSGQRDVDQYPLKEATNAESWNSTVSSCGGTGTVTRTGTLSALRHPSLRPEVRHDGQPGQ